MAKTSEKFAQKRASELVSAQVVRRASGRQIEVSQENLKDMEQLIEELLKKSPSQKRVQALMEKSGLDYMADPIQQLNSVLFHLNSSPTTRIRNPESGSSL